MAPVAASAAEEERKKTNSADDGDDIPLIDMDTFNQLQEMDDDEDEREFSRGIVWTYFEQVPEKLDVIKTNLQPPENYLEVSQVAHFLKGSSAALGVARVTALFEKIQVTANEIYKAEKAARKSAASGASPSFDSDTTPSAALTATQKTVLESAKSDVLAREAKNVTLVKGWFEKVQGEYKKAEEWLRGEYEAEEDE